MSGLPIAIGSLQPGMPRVSMSARARPSAWQCSRRRSVPITGHQQQNYRVRWAVTAGIVVLSTLSGMRLQAAPVEAPLTVPLNEEAAAEVERPTPDNPGAALARARKVRFLFEVKCEPCHGRKEQKGEFDVRTMASLLKGGKSGPALVRGDAEASLLFRRIADDQMPPRAVRYKLSIKSVTVPELAMIRAWIDEGAVDPPPQPGVVEDDGLLVSDEDKTWWAFQKPVQPAIPVLPSMRSSYANWRQKVSICPPRRTVAC